MAPNNWIHNKNGEKNYYTGVFWAGAPRTSVIARGGLNFSERNFFVTKEGFLFSRAGQIGGWEISADKLVKMHNFEGSEKTPIAKVGMSPGYNGFTNHKNLCFWSGTISTNDEYEVTFYVNNTGYLYTKYGEIGNWHIGTGGLYATGSESPDITQ